MLSIDQGCWCGDGIKNQTEMAYCFADGKWMLVSDSQKQYCQLLYDSAYDEDVIGDPGPYGDTYLFTDLSNRCNIGGPTSTTFSLPPLPTYTEFQAQGPCSSTNPPPQLSRVWPVLYATDG